MKLSDYVADHLAKLGIRHCFVIQGGAIAHMIDSVGRHPDMEYVCTAHEQAAAMAVDGYVRTTGGLGCAMATTGPGVINLMTGIACLYYDSLPAIFIGGQVASFRLSSHVPGVRQLGFQESPHIELVSSITKYAVLIDDPPPRPICNDEVLHTGYAPMCHYIWAVAAGLKPEFATT